MPRPYALIQGLFDDPGYFALKRAGKMTLSMVFIVLVGARFTSGISIVYAVLALFPALLFNESGTKSYQLGQALLISASMIATLLLGMGLKGFPVIAFLALLVLAFLSFYVARFGTRFTVWPIFAVMTYLISIYMPFEIPVMPTLFLVFMGLGFILLFIFVFPYSLRCRQDAELVRLCEHYEGVVSCFLRGLRASESQKNQVELMSLWQKINARLIRLDPDDELFVKFYAFSRVLRVLDEVLFRLNEANSLSPEHHDKVASEFEGIELTLHRLKKVVLKQELLSLEGEVKSPAIWLPDETSNMDLSNLAFMIWRLSELLNIITMIMKERK